MGYKNYFYLSSNMDPFQIKQLRKYNPKRVFYTLNARLEEWRSRIWFYSYKIDENANVGQTAVFFKPISYNYSDTAVTPTQMNLLINGINSTNHLPFPVVEIGVFRGCTTSVLASRTSRPYFGIDPYIGYGGVEFDLKQMLFVTRDLPNFSHLRCTSGAAIRSGVISSCSFVFVDAVHDYVNAKFDGLSWGSLLVTGGVIGFHDTDNFEFPGVQRVVWELLNGSSVRFSLFGHVNGLILLKKEG
jgi:hypothetical protein